MAPTEQPQGTNAEHENQNPEPPPLPVQPSIASGRGRPRGRPLVAKISVLLPQAEAPRLLGNQQCDPEEAHERDSLLEPHPELMTEP